MTTLSSDTHPDAERVQIKLHMVAQMNSTLRTLALNGLRERHPHATPDDLRRRLKRRAKHKWMPSYANSSAQPV